MTFFEYIAINPVAFTISIGVFGLFIGSFLNVVIYRTPKMMEQDWQQECQMLLNPEHPIIEHEKLTLSKPASSCPECHQPIRWYQNIPVISWLMLRGKCGHCQSLL